MPSSLNPWTYALPAVALAAVLLYFLYGAVDRFGLEIEQTEARVTGKQFAAGSTTYNTNVVAGRAHTQSSTNPDAHIVLVDIGGVATGGMVSPMLYESLQPGELVHVAFKRTRLSKRIVVTNVRR
jgi:hypothetical protein